MALCVNGYAKECVYGYETACERECEAGNKESCEKAEKLMQNIESHKQNCNSDNILSCVFVGGSYINGNSKDYKQASEYFTQACDGDIDKTMEWWRKDDNKAISLVLTKDLVIQYKLISCATLAAMYYKGFGVEVDYDKSLNLFDKVCNNNYQCDTKECNKAIAKGCFGLGFLHLEGKGVKANWGTAKRSLEKSCNLGDEAGCDEYNKIVEFEEKIINFP